ncbi:YbaB/EbfC family nucleoid-associated protein [Nocardioides perillae]|uniref:Nucleoid-associated protein BJ989_000732 n=1 Tax=Nocardioides perillae TaxID=1119534 RepID=A0A7Y9RTL5_9ACTN|nr:YbaB/EbfC family nucleoid-associated protein [Nocardioides perillae]NYG54428.1 hypothetical protein [Nocardioides perillae]
MTQNPFEALGGGGFDVNALLQQAQAMQQQLQEAQQRLHDETVEGSAGGAVTVTVNGVGDLVKVDVTPGRFDGGDADDLTDLGDLVVAAYRDAKAKADALAGEALGPLAGGGAGGGLGDLGGLLGGGTDDAGPGATPGRLGF